MTPEEKARRYYLWNKIEHMVFCPASPRDQSTWCSLYIATLGDLWGIDPPITESTFPAARVHLTLPEFAFEYDLSLWSESPQRASLRLFHGDSEVACHDIDHAYHDRISLTPDPAGSINLHYPNAATNSDDLLTDIRWVLDRYVFHPCAHLHLNSARVATLIHGDDAFRECLHEIRFGSGITNPFVALFQYRVNLMLRSTPTETRSAKAEERDRVAAIIRDAIRDRNSCVNAKKLFGRRW